MNPSVPPTTSGAFVQLIEYRTDRPEQMQPIIARWLESIGGARTARWYLTAADRDAPGTFIQLVEFPDHAAAMSNSDHPATAQFAQSLREICGDELTFRNLDVVDTAHL